MFPLGNGFRQLKRDIRSPSLLSLFHKQSKHRVVGPLLKRVLRHVNSRVAVLALSVSITSGIPCFFWECWIASGRTASSDRCRLAASERQSRRLRVYGFETMLNLVYSHIGEMRAHAPHIDLASSTVWGSPERAPSCSSSSLLIQAYPLKPRTPDYTSCPGVLSR